MPIERLDWLAKLDSNRTSPNALAALYGLSVTLLLLLSSHRGTTRQSHIPAPRRQVPSFGQLWFPTLKCPFIHLINPRRHQ
jgi:hypothetical protein